MQLATRGVAILFSSLIHTARSPEYNAGPAVSLGPGRIGFVFFSPAPAALQKEIRLSRELMKQAALISDVIVSGPDAARSLLAATCRRTCARIVYAGLAVRAFSFFHYFVPFAFRSAFLSRPPPPPLAAATAL